LLQARLGKKIGDLEGKRDEESRRRASIDNQLADLDANS
jgi:hypothetical protein